MNRRSALQLGGSSVLFLGSGCLGWFQNTVRLCQIDIDITSTINSLQLRLSEREETIYEETYKIDSSDEPTNRVAIDDSDIPVNEGEFTLHGRVDGHGWKEWFLPQFADGADSISVSLSIEGSPPEFWFGYRTDVDC
ncbi:hypothetical protein ACT4ML_04800 [Natrinema sp. LN54]|uniref:hypothetical protein n=1 Tax=Natrinema sp. LN54 TaxID=3458705 RepID=UPI0040364A78